MQALDLTIVDETMVPSVRRTFRDYTNTARETLMAAGACAGS
jgi:hypothetical protein